MTTPWNLQIFDIFPVDKEQPGAPRIVIPGSAPKTFTLGMLLAVDGVSLIWGALIVFTSGSVPLTTIIISEALFLISVMLLILARVERRFPVSLIYYAIVFVLSMLLNIIFPGHWGDFGLLALCGFAIYRFPLRWSWLIAAFSLVGLAETHGLNDILLIHHIRNNSPLMTMLIMAVFICWIGWSRRIQHLQFTRLQEMQKQLREQMERAEELAATRERVRIARDIHDVLAHSLTVLSIQVQATRQLVQQPERVAAKLDDMAALLRESLAESRRVVTLWRETASAATFYGDVATRLQAILDRFSERTGIQGTFEEKGTAHPLNDRQCETLQHVLQETLTNAHRHGVAQHIQAELQWQDAQVILQVQDDGKAQDMTLPPEAGTLHGHHGLQGMRERATALGGALRAGPRKEGGFAVTLSLPLEKAKQLQEGKQ